MKQTKKPPLKLSTDIRTFSSKNAGFFQFCPLIKSSRKSNSAVLFAILHEYLAEVLSCDNVVSSLSLVYKTQKKILIVFQVLVGLGSE